MQTLTRAEAADKLLDRYTGYFDITHADQTQTPLVATCDFHAHSEKYVLSKKAKLWEAGSHEYVFLFSVPHLTEDIYKSCRDYALENGMAKVEPGPTHMYSYITAVFLCDSCDEAAKGRCGRPAYTRASRWPSGDGWISIRVWQCWRRERHFPTPAEEVQHSF